MGAFKPLLPFGDKTVIECCLDYLREGGIERIVVVVGHRAGEIRDRLKDVTFAINPDPASEMGASIAIGIQTLHAKAAVIALVDHPAIPPEIVTQIVQEWQKGGRIVIPTWQNRGGHPVLVDLAFKDELLNLDRTGGLRAMFKKHEKDINRIPVDSPFVARDMDTWDDYALLYEEVVGHPPPKPEIGHNERSEGLI
jgi:molybdenum cofactor cytidylyltransferase